MTEGKVTRDQAQAEADRAARAVSSVVGATRFFANRAAGEAATATDQVFTTTDAGNNLIYYRSTADGSVQIFPSAFMTLNGEQTGCGSTFAGTTQFLTEGGSVGITSGAVPLSEANAILHVVNDDDASVGILCQSYWTGSAASPYVNNDTTLFETYNRTLDNSANRSWAASCSNAYHDVPAGVADSGTRVGAIGWAVSVKGRSGYDHRGTIESMHGIEGTSGFQGQGYAGAVIREAAGVRGLIYADSLGGTINYARGGIFVSDGLGLDGTLASATTIEDNVGVYARAKNGTIGNWSFFGDGGTLYNKDNIATSAQVRAGGKIYSSEQIAAGSEYSQSGSRVAARVAGNSFEFGYPDQGYGCNIGATQATGLPFIAFCAEADPTGDTFRTRGKRGHVILPDLNGTLTFYRVAEPNAAGQSLSAMAAFDVDGKLNLLERPVVPSEPPVSATAPGKAGEITWEDGFLYVCVAENTWQRSALATW